MTVRGQNDGEIAALLIAPDRDLAQQFLATLPQTRSFQILADLKNYPPQQTLEIRARQLKPQVILLELVSDLAAATELVRFIATLQPAVHVVGLHSYNDPAAILQSLRAGKASASARLHSLVQGADLQTMTKRDLLGNLFDTKQPPPRAR